MPQSGYFISYYTNETNVTVYLDNIVVNHSSGPLLQESDTYAFGGGIDALESRSFGRAENKYGYNGKEKQPDLRLEWLDYGARMYDAQVGRWGWEDPLAEKFYDVSTYNYALNNPIMYIDPDGREILIFYFDDNDRIQYHKYEYGTSYKGENQFIIDTYKVFDYLIENDIDSELKYLAETTDGTLKIGDSKTVDHFGYNPEYNIIWYSPYSAAELKNGEKQTPAFRFFHEIVHAEGDIRDPVGFKNRSDTHDPDHSDLEEKKAWEAQVDVVKSGKVNEGLKEKYIEPSKRLYWSKGPTSTKEDRKYKNKRVHD